MGSAARGIICPWGPKTCTDGAEGGRGQMAARHSHTELLGGAACMLEMAGETADLPLTSEKTSIPSQIRVYQPV